MNKQKKAKAFALLELTSLSKGREATEYYMTITAIENQNILRGVRNGGGGYYFNRKINGLIKKVTLKQRLLL